MKLVGLLMMRNDHDILPQVLDCNMPHFEAVYVLDGSDDHDHTLAILARFADKLAGVYRDSDLPPDYHQPPRDGARQFLLDKIKADIGDDGWIFCLHSDEMFYDVSPERMVLVAEERNCDLISIRNVHFFLHTSQKDDYHYDPRVPVMEQIKFACFPGFRERRAFKNRPHIRYDINRHSGIVPFGLTRELRSSFAVRHYLYRSPEQMLKSIDDRFARNWQSYGKVWYEAKQTCFVDILPKYYSFTRRIEVGQRILDGIQGTLS
jgi:hypothetical protein